MIYQISTGQGPAECQLGAAKLLDYLKRRYPVTVLDTSPGALPGLFRSVRFETDADLSALEGPVLWICQSPYRPRHKRKNWFLDLSRRQRSTEAPFAAEQAVFETFRSGGKGGQNVNKVETGVRAVYPPTGQSVVCTEERSQWANRQKALARLRRLVAADAAEHRAAEKRADWRCHTSLTRGGPAAVFRGTDFRRMQ